MLEVSLEEHIQSETVTMDDERGGRTSGLGIWA